MQISVNDLSQELKKKISTIDNIEKQCSGNLTKLISYNGKEISSLDPEAIRNSLNYEKISSIMRSYFDPLNNEVSSIKTDILKSQIPVRLAKFFRTTAELQNIINFGSNKIKKIKPYKNNLFILDNNGIIIRLTDFENAVSINPVEILKSVLNKSMHVIDFIPTNETEILVVFNDGIYKLNMNENNIEFVFAENDIKFISSVSGLFIVCKNDSIILLNQNFKKVKTLFTLKNNFMFPIDVYSEEKSFYILGSTIGKQNAIAPIFKFILNSEEDNCSYERVSFEGESLFNGISFVNGFAYGKIENKLAIVDLKTFEVYKINLKIQEEILSVIPISNTNIIILTETGIFQINGDDYTAIIDSQKFKINGQVVNKKIKGIFLYDEILIVYDESSLDTLIPPTYKETTETTLAIPVLGSNIEIFIEAITDSAISISTKSAKIIPLKYEKTKRGIYINIKNINEEIFITLPTSSLFGGAVVRNISL